MSIDSAEMLDKLKKASAFLDKLKEMAEDLRREIDDLRRVAHEITTMIISDAESIRDELLAISKRVLKLEEKT